MYSILNSQGPVSIIIRSLFATTAANGQTLTDKQTDKMTKQRRENKINTLTACGCENSDRK